MNQATNEKPFGLLSLKDQEKFCEKTKSDGGYEYYGGRGWKAANFDPEFYRATVYRLKIQANRWYYCESKDGAIIQQGKNIHNDNEIAWTTISEYDILRPATASEIPKQEKTLKERIEEEYSDFEVKMCGWDHSYWCILADVKRDHTKAQSMKGFYKYVYHGFLDHDGFLLSFYPIWPDNDAMAFKPLAVLFEKGGE